jgi:alkaline phosphatase
MFLIKYICGKPKQINMKIKSGKSFIIIIILVASILLLSKTSLCQTPTKEVKNIILFIGDGMGTAQVYGAMTASEHKLILESFPFTGFSKTYSYDNYVTDSGAGGTAIACGIKTRNEMIGMSPDSVPVNSILEIAHQNKMATGIVVTSSVTDATPAAFVAHVINRGYYEDIAKAYLNGTVDVFIGGGEGNFRDRLDNADLTIMLKKQGYDVVYSIDSLKKSSSRMIAGLLAKGNMPTVRKGRVGVLSEMTRKAIQTLSRDPNGFFLMVEGSLIDKNAHGKNLPETLTEVIDMDEAIGVAKDFADKNKQTLIVVTADHETGGLTLVDGDIKNHLVTGSFIESGSHTGVMIPIFSYGAGAQYFSGIHDNTFFFYRFIKLINAQVSKSIYQFNPN